MVIIAVLHSCVPVKTTQQSKLKTSLSKTKKKNGKGNRGRRHTGARTCCWRLGLFYFGRSRFYSQTTAASATQTAFCSDRSPSVSRSCRMRGVAVSAEHNSRLHCIVLLLRSGKTLTSGHGRQAGNYRNENKMHRGSLWTTCGTRVPYRDASVPADAL